MTFAEIKGSIRSNLNDAGVTFYSANDITDSLQDAYDDVAFLAKNILKSVDLDFRIGPYYDFGALIPDFLQVVAIFNQNTNRWLKDNLSITDFDKLRMDWELWSATPEWWAVASLSMNAIVPYYSTVPSLPMTIYYAAQAPTIVDTTETPLIDIEYQELLEWYCTADLLEQAEEYVKANTFWKQYMEHIVEYADKCQNNAKRDLLVII